MSIGKTILHMAQQHASIGRESEKLTFDGLEYIIGNLKATQALIKFNRMYDLKHGDYLFNATMAENLAQTDAYHRRRMTVWNRYALFIAHDHDKKVLDNYSKR